MKQDNTEPPRKGRNVAKDGGKPVKGKEQLMRKSNPTIEDVKRIWDVKWGNYCFSKEEKERQWKAFKKQGKKDFGSIEALYEFLCKATGLI